MGRPHTPLLDRDRIAAAALRLTDRRGDFTILDLARALKVTPAAIYHHVAGRAEIVTLLRQKMARTVDASAFGQLPWDQALRCWATSYRETFAAHAGAISMLAAEPIADPAVHAQYERAVTALEDAGFPRAMVLAVITAVESFVLGSALDLVAPPVMVTGIDAAATPRLAEAAAAAPAGRRRADQAWPRVRHHHGGDHLGAARLQQQHPGAGILAQSGCEHGPGRPAAYDDVVVFVHA